MAEGISPLIQFSSRLRFLKLIKLVTSFGIVPFNELYPTSKFTVLHQVSSKLAAMPLMLKCGINDDYRYLVVEGFLFLMLQKYHELVFDETESQLITNHFNSMSFLPICPEKLFSAIVSSRKFCNCPILESIILPYRP